MSLLSFFQWLEGTNLSIAFHESVWMYPIVESVHVLALCLFLGMALFWDLRLLSVTFWAVPATEVEERLFPWMKEVEAAARQAGALGCVLSGAGSAMLAAVRGPTESVERAMEAALRAAGGTGKAMNLGVDTTGATWQSLA